MATQPGWDVAGEGANHRTRGRVRSPGKRISRLHHFWKRHSSLKILILKPSSLGDVVHALPVLRLLKLHLPHSEIFWWLESSLIPLLEGDPDLAGIFPFQRNTLSKPSRWPGIWTGIRAMRDERHDWAIDLQGLARSGFNTWLANADLSIGLDNAREGNREGARLFYDIIAPRSAPGTHAVDRYLAVLPELGAPVHKNFQWLPVRPGVAAMVRARWQPGTARWVALLPGARWDNKRWPLEYFQEVARRLPGQTDDMKFVIVGGKDDRALGAAIAAANPERCLDLTGLTSLPELIEWLRLCNLVITNDSGPDAPGGGVGQAGHRAVRANRPTEHRAIQAGRERHPNGHPALRALHERPLRI